MLGITGTRWKSRKTMGLSRSGPGRRVMYARYGYRFATALYNFVLKRTEGKKRYNIEVQVRENVNKFFLIIKLQCMK